MRSFDHVKDFDHAVSLGRKYHPQANVDFARFSMSGYNEEEVLLIDSYGDLICAFPADEFMAYRTRRLLHSTEGLNTESSDSTLGEKDIFTRYEHAKRFASPAPMRSTPRAARSARTFVDIVKACSILVSVLIVITGALATTAMSRAGFGFTPEILISSIAIAFFSYLGVRLAYIGIEILADISDDVRLIRLFHEMRAQDATACEQGSGAQDANAQDIE